MREIRQSRADSGVDFYAHGSEPKDIARFVMPAFKEIISARKQKKNIICRLKMVVEGW